jgi:hypothetical protein
MRDPEDDPAEVEARIRERLTRSAPAWSGAIRLLLVIQAALADMTPPQRERMRKRMSPLIDHLRETGDPSPIRRLIREILGPDWQPTGEAAEWIQSMTDHG